MQKALIAASPDSAADRSCQDKSELKRQISLYHVTDMRPAIML